MRYEIEIESTWGKDKIGNVPTCFTYPNESMSMLGADEAKQGESVTVSAIVNDATLALMVKDGVVILSQTEIE